MIGSAGTPTGSPETEWNTRQRASASCRSSRRLPTMARRAANRGSTEGRRQGIRMQTAPQPCRRVRWQMRRPVRFPWQRRARWPRCPPHQGSGASKRALCSGVNAARRARSRASGATRPIGPARAPAFAKMRGRAVPLRPPFAEPRCPRCVSRAYGSELPDAGLAYRAAEIGDERKHRQVRQGRQESKIQRFRFSALASCGVLAVKFRFSALASCGVLAVNLPLFLGVQRLGLRQTLVESL